MEPTRIINLTGNCGDFRLVVRVCPEDLDFLVRIIEGEPTRAIEPR
jgi:hypothetical protein